MTPAMFDLVVIAGSEADSGVRATVGSQPIVVGRSTTAGLVLSDPRVSREHAQAVAAETGVAFAVLTEARRLLVFRGERVERAFVALGGEVQVGDTILRVEQTSRAERRMAPRTLMTGEADDVRAAAALYSLSDALRDAGDRANIERTIAEWACRAPVSARDARLARPDDARPNGEVIVRSANGGRSVAVIPMHAPHDQALVVEFALPPEKVAESMQRLLVIAGMIVGSRLAAVHSLEGLRGDRDALRAMALGVATTFLGSAPAARRVATRVERLARADVLVLLTGETGTGKTFVARLLHERGPRADRSFRAVNCAAIPDSLIEAELFGAERGAYTGASASRPGVFEATGDGTLFLDEIGELSLIGQAKLLRVLEERRFERIGSTKTIEFRGQVVLATNRDLAGMAKEGRFREDLFFRVSAHTIEIPPLRERAEDIATLANRFLADLAPARGARARTISPDALAHLRTYAWPGNVRELRNAIDYAIVNTDGEMIVANALPERILRDAMQPQREGASVSLPANHLWLDEQNFSAALSASRGNVTKAAELIGMNRVSLHKRLRRRKS